MIEILLQLFVFVFNFVVPLVSYALLIGADVYIIIAPSDWRDEKLIGGALGFITLILVVVINLYTHFLAPFDIPVPLTLLVLFVVIAMGIFAGFSTLALVRYLFVEHLVGFIIWVITAGLLISAYFFVASQNVRVLLTVGALAFLMGNFIFLLLSGPTWLRDIGRGSRRQRLGKW